MSVSPVADKAGDESCGEEEGEGSDGEGEGVMEERLSLPEEDAFVRKVKDPKLPTQDLLGLVPNMHSGQGQGVVSLQG